MIKTSLFADQEREAKLNKLAMRCGCWNSTSTLPRLLPPSTVQRHVRAESAAAARR